MNRVCSASGASFEIPTEDLEFYKRLEVPPPKLCPEERMRRRYAFRSEYSLYTRSCDLTGERIFSQHDADCEHPVYSNPAWWGDAWDAQEFALEFDFSKTFVENFQPLRRAVPQPATGVLHSSMVNSDYCNQAGYLKDCYLVVNSDESERCFYSKGANRCYDCVDCYKVYDCEGCYECLNCNNCSFSTYLSDSQNSSDCHFSAFLIGCEHCFGCFNLRNQRFCFFNEQLLEAEYHSRVAEFRAAYPSHDLRVKFIQFCADKPLRWMQEKNTENCTGDYLVNCKDCHFCFDSEELERSRYCSDIKRGQGVSFGNYDVSYFGMGITECYESAVIGYGANRVFFCQDVYPGEQNCITRFGV